MARTQLGVIAFGGNTHSGATSGDPVVEVWECHLAIHTDPALVTFSQAEADALANIFNIWFVNGDTKISSTESFDYLKWNEFNLATGRQITDPTVISLPGSNRGGGGAVNPVSTSFKISLDNSTRNPRARGGFFPPRSSATIAQNGRITTSQWAPMVATAQTLFDSIHTMLDVGGAVGVWSRRDHAVHESNRFRIGDVPDNVSRRRNHLREGYTGGAI